jgi:hypothetical protein
MGSVWRAEHLSLRTQVAIKLVDPSLAGRPDALARFLRETQVVRRTGGASPTVSCHAQQPVPHRPTRNRAACTRR